MWFGPPPLPRIDCGLPPPPPRVQDGYAHVEVGYAALGDK